jgi:cell division protein FtsW (lipid II flippase)
MNKLMINHETYMRSSLDDSTVNLDWLLIYHKSWIQFMQHERLIHLLVTLALSILFIITFGISLFIPNQYFLILFAILAVLLIFYIFHYYKLENGVQRWYSIYNDLMYKTRQKY